MIGIKDIKMKKKLISLFLISGLVPLLIIGLLSTKMAEKSLKNAAYNQLISMRATKADQIEKYFSQRKSDLEVLTETVSTLRLESFKKLDAIRSIKAAEINTYFSDRLKFMEDVKKNLRFTEAVKPFTKAFNAGLNSMEYSQLEKKKQAGFKSVQDSFGFYDLFLINLNGDIIYTAEKKADLGKNLLKGPLKNSGLAQAFIQGQKKISLIDFQWYEPSKEPASFLSVPLFNDSEQLIGVAAFQISLQEINKIMGNRVGMGKTGETYLVGPDHLMRSDSFFDPQNHTVKSSFANPAKGRIKTEASISALAGNSGMDVIKDYNGNPVLSSWSPITMGDVTWAIIAEIDVEEAFSPVNQEGTAFYNKYTDIYGYYDLFLINPDGYVFYTATKGADYQTNMINGKYANSNLGELTRQVLKTEQFGMADFKPYAPSSNAPAAFIAQPFIHQGDVELVIALQLPLEGINAIMQQRDGMGETGETYLVGQDKRMRSDSFMDKNGRSVAASFAGTVQNNGVDTEASRQALAGKTDTKITQDFNKTPILSSYAPIDIGDTTWALIAEIDEAEVLQPIYKIYKSIAIVALLIALFVGIMAFFIAKQIADPLVKGVEFAKLIANKDLTTKLDIKQGDEIGDLAHALNEMVTSLADMINDIDDGVNTLSSSSTEMSAIATEMSSGAETTVSKSNTVSAAAEEMTTNMSSVAASMEEASTNISTVASGTEEMSASIAEISGNTATARESVNNAVERSQRASTQVNELGQAAEEISVVTETIKSISDKTNLLALNATIEAARAGEAGKGFAVVANEIKELAKQTAEATEDIAAKLQGIQSSTGMTITEIQEVSTAIHQVDEIVNAIASAVEQQNASTNEISENVGQASLGLQEINENVNQSSTASGEIASEIAEVNDAAAEMSNSSAQVQQTSSELSSLAEQLKGLVSQFKV